MHTPLYTNVYATLPYATLLSAFGDYAHVGEQRLLSDPGSCGGSCGSTLVRHPGPLPPRRQYDTHYQEELIGQAQNICVLLTLELQQSLQQS